VPELAPDADDLGEVLRALCRVGGSALAETCEDPIALALESAGDDGAFPTWILDPLGMSSADEACRAYLWIGGKGIHPEVVANLLCALHEYDCKRFDVPLRRAREYFEATQGDDGFWESRWYAGPFYGTYRVAAFLSSVDRSHPALARARRSLLAAQRGDGGWGEEASDPLSTSFAVLTLAADGAGAAAARSRAAAYVAAAQEPDGGWPACLWGSFETGVGLETYGSRSVTTAYCLKALLAQHAMPCRSPAGELVAAGRA
jgi:squalene cyclase